MRCRFAAPALLTAIVAAGCAGPNPARFYKSFHRDDVVLTRSVVPKVVWSGNAPEVDYDDALANNFAPVGESSFRAQSKPTRRQIERLAEREGASVACAYRRYAGSDVVYAPIALPTSSTTTTQVYGNTSGSVHGSSFGGGGVTSYSGYGGGTFSGTATTTSYGTQWSSIPITRHFYDFNIILYAPLRQKLALGLVVADIDEETASRIGTRQGVSVKRVVKGSPCHAADILIGDFITAINGTPTRNLRDFKAVADSLPEQGEVSLSIIRSSESIEKTVQL